jgi:hypothetical protein
MADDPQPESDPRLDALASLVRFVQEHDEGFIREDVADQLLLLTTMRSCNTTLAVHKLLLTDSIEQAQMLCRPLFEDTVAMHWLVMQEDPTFLIERFFAYQAAQLVREHEYVTSELRLPFPDIPGLADALTRRTELQDKFGRHAERAWWNARPDGSRIGLAGIISELETHEAYRPRLHGGAERAMRNHYVLAHRWAELQLHHTPEGLPFALTRAGIFGRDRQAQATLVAESAYWAFGQTIYLQLTFGARDRDTLREFDAMYAGTYGTTFAQGMSDEEVRAALAEARATVGTDPPESAA